MSIFGTSGKKTAEIQTLKKEVDRLRQSEDDLKKVLDENQKHEDEIARLKGALEEENDRLRNENREMKEKLDTEEPYEKLYNERENLKQEESVKSSKIEELETERNEMNKTIEALQTELKNTKKELKQIKSNFETEKGKMDEMFQERESLDAKITELEKEKVEFEDELKNLKDEIQKKEDEEDEEKEKNAEQKEKDDKYAKQYLEDLRKETREHKSKVEVLQLESEALKSENEALFRANESKKKDMDEILGELNSIRNELKIEQQRFVKLKQEWDEEKKRTEFVIVSKSPTKTPIKSPTKSGKRRPPGLDDDDSEDEHVVSVTEAARAEAESLREKERGLRKRINQLQIDKEELFRSGTNLFAENKNLKGKFDEVCNERTRLLQAESNLQHKLREKEKEIKDLKKTVDDLYYQNLAIKSNEENESKTNAYVVLMGNERVKQLEREKSALHRRVKYLERENQEIEDRVNELEKQSDALITYSKKYDKHTPFPPLKGPFDVDTAQRTTRSTRNRPRSRDLSPTYVRTQSRERDQYSSERRSTMDRQRQDRPRSNQRRKDGDNVHQSTYRVPERQRAQHDYRNELRPPIPRIRSPDYYRDNVPPFVHQNSRQPSFTPSNQSHSSRFSLPPLSGHFDGPRPDTRSDNRRA